MKMTIMLITAGLAVLASPLLAATIPVTTTNPAVATDGQCSLIEAIINANSDTAYYADCPAGSGADTIELASSEVYELDEVYVSSGGPNGLPIVVSTIVVEGDGSTIRRAAGAPEFRFVLVGPSGDLTLNDVTLEGGDSGDWWGGALENQSGTVALNRTTVTANTAISAGAIYNNSGTMTLTDSVVSLNTGTGGPGGIRSEAVTNDAIMVIESSLITGNEAIGSAAGGIYAASGDTWTAELHVRGSEFTGNTAEFNGGGIRAQGAVVVIEDTTVSENQTFSETRNSYCAGLSIVGGTAEIRRSTISGNTTESLADLTGFGGGVCAGDNTTIISNCTISGNEARGAATTGSMSGRGGGIMVVGGYYGSPQIVDTLVIIEDSTISDNSAETVGGGISAYRLDGTMAVTVELRNTIVAENYEGGGAVLGNCVEESPATVASLDFNLADDLTCNLVGTNDLVVADVMLAPLADNGGPNWTHLPEAGSPAVDSGDDLLCPEIDQRGYVRPWDGDDDGQIHCDRGAVELGAPFFADGFETGGTSGWSSTVP